MNKQAVLLTLLAATFGATAAPYTPATGNVVLERLPSRSDPAQRELAAARAKLAADPRNPELAAAVARRYVTLGREDADPRYLGYAQAALAPWWSAATPPAPVQLLRATILQSTHQFPAALRDLDQLVQANPADAQAWLTRATVQQVTGDFAGARQSCTRLFGIAPDLVLRTCLAGVGSLTGTARASYLTLNQAYAAHRSTGSGIADWVLTLLGEMAARLGDAPAAERHFRQALALAPLDAYLLGAYADFLLDQNRAAEAVPLLRGHEKADALLLRLGLALAATGGRDTATVTAMLRDRFAAAQLRGDTVHQREQARFELALERQPARALALAKQNWAVQKEPADLRILLDSALAAKDKAALATVRAWVRQTGIEDVAVQHRLAGVAP
ncbi:hypothetical protein GJV26_21215 [Massilia dura]|uniref:Tetratricopeptide repeat protein n=1 Tax=Pseudoduganella dura TaxID=321982 RepID=A0A6I3XHE2_9BURK|nr:hypothetical protein [Pseudoduganella dura]MUI14966.1 hypothetical protein [Pseudoduganella dura]GGY01235.1 hypothetical protein GCM10007386_35250 [Pseudoduganella dura]